MSSVNLDDITQMLKSPEGILAEKRFYDENREKIYETFGFQWICINGRRIIDSSDSYSQLMEKLFRSHSLNSCNYIVRVTPPSYHSL